MPNELRAMVKLGEVVTEIHNRNDKLKIPLFLGKDVKERRSPSTWPTCPTF